MEQTTDKIAQEAVNRIKTSIDKANLAKELSQVHNREVQESMEQQ